jgi:hypothetical protein
VLAGWPFPDRLHRHTDEIAAVIRDPMAAQSALRLDKFEQAMGMKPADLSPEQLYGPNYPGVHEIKRFIDKRAESVRRQLDGKSRGDDFETSQELIHPKMDLGRRRHHPQRNPGLRNLKGKDKRQYVL